MSAQLGIFDPPRPVSRRTDPETSRISEKHLRETGRLNDGCRRTLAALRDYIARHGEAPTSAELAGGDVSLRYAYGRRLSDLRAGGHVKNGPPRECKAMGSQAMTWEPKP